MINALLDRTKIDGKLVDDVIFGCVSQVGAQAANVARGAVLGSKLPISVPATTVDRQCGSSQQALHFAAQAVMSGTQDIVIAGGVELMSLVPIGRYVFPPNPCFTFHDCLSLSFHPILIPLLLSLPLLPLFLLL